MTLDEKRWQKKLARKRKAQASRRPPPQRSNLLSPAQAAHRPIHDAIIAADLFANGIGLVGLARALPDGDVALSAFLVDVYCLGVKNAFYRVVSPEEWGQFVEGMELEKIHPSCLRKLVEGAVAYARDLGFPPHADYARAATLFGSIEAAVCPVRYTYGQNGKPFYVSGPDETPAQARRILNTLTRRLGADGFHFLAVSDGPGVAAPGAGEEEEPLASSRYEVTAEPLPDPQFEQLPAAVQARINELHGECQELPWKALPELKALIEQYPDLPLLYNFWYVACRKLGEDAEALRVLQQMLERFPDYLFGRMALADEYLQRGESEKVAEIFAGQFDLGLLYPDRKRFHLSEALAFQNLLARYFHALGDRQQAQRCHALMCELAPQDPATQQIGRLLASSRVTRWLREKLLRR